MRFHLGERIVANFGCQMELGDAITTPLDALPAEKQTPCQAVGIYASLYRGRSGGGVSGNITTGEAALYYEWHS
jgi:hypothetical protein